MGKETELFKAAQSGNTAMLERVFANHLKRISGQPSHHGSTRSKLHPNIQDANGSTLLHHAILNGHKDTVQLLLRCGASTSIVDNSGSAPLHLAAWKGDLDIVKMLVTQGPSYANVNQQSDSEDTALHLASQYGYSTVVEFLLQRHADPLLRNNREETPLDLAAQYGHLACVLFLISFSPETLRPAPRGLSPLHLAARNGHTIVALSLINAGISVNTTCERGSALHEAALCGKVDMVELLLDKGVDCDLKDCEGRTVLDLLQFYTANQATEISRKIRLHLDDERRLRTRSLRNPASRVLAVAKTTSQPLVEGSSALAFSTGDQIVVQRNVGGGVYYGTVRGNSGSFLAEDVFFYKEVDGTLVATEESELNMIPDPLTNRLSYREPTPTAMATSPPTLPSLEEVSVEEEETSGSSSNLTPPMERSRPHSKSAGEPTLSLSPPAPDHPRPHSVGGDDGISGHLATPPGPSRSKSQESPLLTCETASSPTSSPRVSGGSEPSSRPPESVVPGPKVLGGPGPGSRPPESAPGEEEPMARKMTKKEKRFVLSKDKGQYSELNPISPHEAKKEFGESLHLKSIESPGVGVAVGGASVDASLFPSAVPQPSAGNEGEFRGSYYVLEVGNFGELSPTSECTSGAESRLSDVLSDTSSRVETQPLAGESGYFLLNTNDPGGQMEDDVYSSVSARRTANYQNVRDFPEAAQPSTGSSAGTDRVHPHLVMVEDSSGSQALRVSSGSSKSSYENVSVTAASDGASALLGDNRSCDALTRRPLSSYENVDNLAASRDSSSTPNATPSANTGDVEMGRIKRSAQQRRDAYEVMPLRKSKGSGSGGSGTKTGTDATSATACGQINTSSVADASSERGRTEECAAGANNAAHHGEDGGRGPGPGEQNMGGVSTVNESNESNQRERRNEGTSAPTRTNGVASFECSIIHSTGEDPFAGLVMTGTQNHAREGSTPGGGAIPEGGNPELWDSIKVEQEWTQIESLMQDVKGTFGSPPVSPVVESDTGPPTEILAWLHMVGLEGYSSILLVHGFDNLRFLGGNILSMDDLDDIGISCTEDQYNLMAAVSLLAPPPPVGHASTVTEWLGLLDLSLLQSKFEKYTLNKVSTFWDVQLSSVIGVELLGHRKRLQYGIQELRQVHPDWAQSYEVFPGNKQSVAPPAASPRKPSPVRKPFLRDYRAMRSSSSMSSNSDVATAHIKMRSPAEAQAGGGSGEGGKRVARLPSQIWPHDNESLMKASINYHIHYLGSVLVKKLHGKQSAEEACLKLRMSTMNMKKVPDITLSVSWKGVKFLDAHSKHMVSFHAIRDVSFCTSDIEDKKVFSYITKDRSSGKNYAHVFVANSHEVADDIRMTLAQAFEICYQKVMRVRMMSPESN